MNPKLVKQHGNGEFVEFWWTIDIHQQMIEDTDQAWICVLYIDPSIIGPIKNFDDASLKKVIDVQELRPSPEKSLKFGNTDECQLLTYEVLHTKLTMPYFSDIVWSLASSKKLTIQKTDIEELELKTTFSDIILYSKVEWGCRHAVTAFSVVLKNTGRDWLNEAFENTHAVHRLRDSILPSTVDWAFKGLFAEKEDTYLEKSDFEDQEELSGIFLDILKSMISFRHIHEDAIREIYQPYLPQIIMLLCAHGRCYFEGNGPNDDWCSDYWASENTKTLTRYLLVEIPALFNCESVACLLLRQFDHLSCSGEGKRLQEEEEMTLPVTHFSVIVHKMKPHLTRTSWCRNPVMKYVFKIVLQQLHSPHVTNYLQYLLPPALLFLDHHVTENKVLGVQCLLHIMRNVSKEELRWYRRADVIYEAIKQQLYTKEVELISVTHPAILAILEITEKDVCRVYAGDKRSSYRYDDILNLILPNFEGENRIDLRRAMTEHLWMFIDRMGINILKHMKQLFNIIKSYLQVCDGPEETCRLNILKALQELIKVTWPRMFRYEQMILQFLLRFAYDISCETSLTPRDTVERLTNEVTKCLVLMKLAGSGEMETMLKSLRNTSELAVCHKLIDDVLEASAPDQIPKSLS